MTRLIVNISKFDYAEQRRDRTIGIENIHFSADQGEILCLVGKNGSCKTTVARLLNGQLPAPLAGTSITLGSLSLTDGRAVGYLAQDYPLLPWLKVRDNIDFPRRMFKCDTSVPPWLARFIDASDVKAHLDRYPAQLSGGQRQQVALVQALSLDPTLVILDEPYSALSRLAVASVKTLINELQTLGKIVVQIVHDFSDTIDTSTRVLIMNAVREGRYTIVTELPLDDETRNDPLQRQHFASDMAVLAFQEPMMPLSQEDVRDQESSLPPGTEVIVVAIDPEREHRLDQGFSFLPLIVDNLKREVHYTYVFPGFTETASKEQPSEQVESSETSVDAFLGQLLAETRFDRAQLGALLKIYIVAPKTFRFADFVIASLNGRPLAGWEFPTASPNICFQTDISKLPQKLTTVREVLQDPSVARELFP